MARPRKGARVLGPYLDKQQGGWRLIVSEADGRTYARRTATEAEALAVRQELQTKFAEERSAERAAEQTVIGAIDQYECYLRDDKGNKPKSFNETVRRVRAFLRVKEHPAALVRHLTPARAREAYSDECSRIVGSGDTARVVSADTHRNYLAETKTWAAWCVRKGWLPSNPFDQVEGRGRRQKGKAQLRLDEARAWTVAALELAAKGGKDTARAAAAMMTFLLGMRASEIVSRQVRDVDDGGRLLWIVKGKTKAARRTIEVPEVLRPALLALASGRGGLEPLFPSRRREWPRNWVRKICEAAGVPMVSAHGMRGTHMSLAVASGESGHAVARAVGHETAATTMGGSYATEASQAQGERERMLKLLQGGRA